jgi:hypothetical protein
VVVPTSEIADLKSSSSSSSPSSPDSAGVLSDVLVKPLMCGVVGGDVRSGRAAGEVGGGVFLEERSERDMAFVV